VYTSRLEARIWHHTLRQVAIHLGVADPEVAMKGATAGRSF
jgi:hypothetical protein